MFRITTLLTGAPVTGGGIQQFYFLDGDGTGPAAHAAAASFWGDMGAAMSSGVTMTVLPEIEIVDSATGNITGLETTDQVTLTGSAGGDVLPNATQGLIRWRTGSFVNGREVRGRTFLPGMLEANNTAGKPASGTVSVLTTAAQDLVGDPNSTLVIYSRTNHASRVVTGASMWSEWAQLRSRRD